MLRGPWRNWFFSDGVYKAFPLFSRCLPLASGRIGVVECFLDLVARRRRQRSRPCMLSFRLSIIWSFYFYHWSFWMLELCHIYIRILKSWCPICFVHGFINPVSSIIGSFLSSFNLFLSVTPSLVILVVSRTWHTFFRWFALMEYLVNVWVYLFLVKFCSRHFLPVFVSHYCVCWVLIRARHFNCKFRNHIDQFVMSFWFLLLPFFSIDQVECWISRMVVTDAKFVLVNGPVDNVFNGEICFRLVLRFQHFLVKRLSTNIWKRWGIHFYTRNPHNFSRTHHCLGYLWETTFVNHCFLSTDTTWQKHFRRTDWRSKMSSWVVIPIFIYCHYFYL